MPVHAKSRLYDGNGYTSGSHPSSVHLFRADCRAADRIAIHAVLHERHWGGFRASRWRWPERWPSALLPLTLMTLLVLALAQRAVVPEFAPGALDIPQPVRDRAALLFILCWVPAFRYIAQDPGRRRPVPFFAAYGCLYSGYYALAPMLGLANVMGISGRPGFETYNPAVAYTHPVDLLLVGWILLSVGYWGAGKARVRRRVAIDGYLKQLRGDQIRDWAFAVLAIGIAVSFIERTATGWPVRLGGVVNLLIILSHSAIVVLIVLMRRGQLSRWATAGAVVAMTAAVFMDLGGSATGRVIFVLFAVFMGAWIGNRSVAPRYIAAGLAILAACAAIRGVMAEWRTQVWIREQGQTSPLERSKKMLALLQTQVEREGVVETVSRGWNVIGTRSANTDLLIDVMSRTPDEIPYWDGFTYQSLTGALIPRFFWPDKPTKTLGQDFGHRYGYIGPGDKDTSINLPVIVEFYINYGTAGVVAGMVGLGILLRLVDDLLNRPAQSLLLTAAAVPFLARLLVMECDLSLIFGGLLMQLPSVLVLAVLMLWVGGVIPTPRPADPPWYAPLSVPRRSPPPTAAARP